MPSISVVIFRDADGSSPLLEWLDKLTLRAQAKCLARIERLQNLGHEMRRPEADYLRDGMYELRVRLEGINYRILYSFFGRSTAVLLHGFTKERRVRPQEIDLAIARMRKFDQNPEKHSVGVGRNE